MNLHHKGHPWPTAPLRESVSVDPIVLQIVEGTLNSIEAEIEYAIERTARSPMIREAHDFASGCSTVIAASSRGDPIRRCQMASCATFRLTR